MVKIKSHLVFYLTCLFFLLVMGISTRTVISPVMNIDDIRPACTIKNLEPHNPITIRRDSDFSGFPGQGTIEDPYRIENYEIVTTSGMGISISGTTVHFLIKNCHIEAGSYGIHIDDVADETISIINNSVFFNENDGIYVYSSTFVVIENNTAEGNGENGFHLDGCSSSTVMNNSAYGNGLNGIQVSGPYSSISNNTVQDNGGAGIFCQHTGLHTVGISGSTSIHYNIFENDSLSAGLFSGLNDYRKYSII